MARYIDVDALKEKVRYSMLIKMGYLNHWADAGRDIPEEERKQILDSIDLHKAFIELIDGMPVVTINDATDEIKVTNCNHNANDSKMVAFSRGHENGKDIIYRQDAIEAMARRYDFHEKDRMIAIAALQCMPSVQPEQAIKDCRNCKFGNYNDHWNTNFCYYSGDCNNWDKWGPSAQPRLPRWAQKVEKYHEQALKMPHIKKHRAWALYQAYKEYNSYGK